MSARLSREGLAVLELLVQWQLRPHLRSASTGPWGAECKALIIAVAANEPEKRLWASIGKAMQALGLHTLWSQAELLASEQIEQALQRAMLDRPGRLLVFGESLKKGLLALQPSIAESCTVRSVEPLSLLSGRAEHKRMLFRSLVELKREVF
jgi:hypothetical protein